MAKEIAWGWYHELGRGHPERVRLPWAGVRRPLRRARLGHPRHGRVPRRGRARPARPARPRRPRPPPGRRARRLLEALQPLVQAQIAEDLRQHVDERHTPHLGAFVAMLSVYAEVGRLAEVLSVRSRAVDRGPVAELLQLRRQRAARVPGARAAGAGPRGLRALPRARDGGRDRRRRVPGHARPRSPRPSRPTCSSTPGCPTRAPPARATRCSAALMRDGLASEEVLRDEHGAVLRNTGQLRVRPADGALVDAAGRGAPPPVRDRAAHHRAGGGRVHPARHERAEPALQRRRRPRRAARARRRLGSRRGRLKASRRSTASASRRRVAVPTTASLGFRDGES